MGSSFIEDVDFGLPLSEPIHGRIGHFQSFSKNTSAPTTYPIAQRTRIEPIVAPTMSPIFGSDTVAHPSGPQMISELIV